MRNIYFFVLFKSSNCAVSGSYFLLSLDHPTLLHRSCDIISFYSQNPSSTTHFYPSPTTPTATLAFPHLICIHSRTPKFLSCEMKREEICLAQYQIPEKCRSGGVAAGRGTHQFFMKPMRAGIMMLTCITALVQCANIGIKDISHLPPGSVLCGFFNEDHKLVGNPDNFPEWGNPNITLEGNPDSWTAGEIDVKCAVHRPGHENGSLISRAYVRQAARTDIEYAECIFSIDTESWFSPERRHVPYAQWNTEGSWVNMSGWRRRIPNTSAELQSFTYDVLTLALNQSTLCHREHIAALKNVSRVSRLAKLGCTEGCDCYLDNACELPNLPDRNNCYRECQCADQCYLTAYPWHLNVTKRATFLQYEGDCGVCSVWSDTNWPW